MSRQSIVLSSAIKKELKRLSRSGRLALGVVVLLLVLAPLPEGSAYPWALAVVESIIFGLIAVWPLALAFGANSVQHVSTRA